MEEAYVKISLVKEETADDFNSRVIEKEREEQQQEEVDKDEEALKDSSHSSIDEETAQMYYNALEKFEKDEITSQQWYDICAKLLGDLMEKNKDVFVRLKNR
jgi:predicted methyltransferase